METSRNDLVILCRQNTVQTIPATGSRVAARVASAVAEVIAAEGVKVLVALMAVVPGLFGVFTVQTVVEALLDVAPDVADLILEHIPAVFAARKGHVAILPRVESNPAIAAVVVASVGVALFVTPVVSPLLLAVVLDALLQLSRVLVVLIDAVGLISSARRCLVKNVAVLSSPLGIAGALVPVGVVDATAVVARFGGAPELDAGFNLASLADVANVPGALEVVDEVNAGASIFARRRQTVVDVLLAVETSVSFRTGAGVVVEPSRAEASVLARVGLAEVLLILAAATFESGAALADVLIQPVFAGCPVEARIGGTLVDVGGAGGSVVTSGTVALESGDNVSAAAAILAR